MAIDYIHIWLVECDTEFECVKKGGGGGGAKIGTATFGICSG